MTDNTVELQINTNKVALCFEGGGMRGAYTAAVVTTLIKENLVFDWVGGISAGASHTCNYTSWDTDRAQASFISIAKDPRFAGWKHWLNGDGFFNAEWLYEHTSGPDEPLPFNWEQFCKYPGQIRIGALQADDGTHVYFGNQDFTCLEDLMKQTRASSTMPVMMPTFEYRGHTWVDGALGPTGGFPIDAARADGFERLFVVLTQPRNYVKQPPKFDWAMRQYWHKFPAVYEALHLRHKRYNQTREELFDLERDGKVLLFVPEWMPVSNHESNSFKLKQVYRAGWQQAQRELPKWREWCM